MRAARIAVVYLLASLLAFCILGPMIFYLRLPPALSFVLGVLAGGVAGPAALALSPRLSHWVYR